MSLIRTGRQRKQYLLLAEKPETQTEKAPELADANWWRRLRASRAWSLVFDVALILLVMAGVHAWQTRNLPIDQPVPATVLATLGSGNFSPATVEGKTGIVYFFAPWCGYCRTSIGNLQDMVDSNRVDWGTAIALDYADAESVTRFVQETGLTLPVLMGNSQTSADWSVNAFPTYYVIDKDGQISSRSVGYSTYLGMWARAWSAD